MVNDIEILDSKWFNDFSGMNSYIGIVKAKNVEGHNEISFRIGGADGEDQEKDEIRIALTGSRFPLESGEALFN